MSKTILLPVAPDHSEALAPALEVARKLADPGASITVIAVIEAVPIYVAAELPEAIFAETRENVEKELKGLLADAPDVKLDVVTGHAPNTILDRIKEDGVDLVVLRSHKPGLQDWVIGSTAGRVVRHAPCSVHVIR
ncbi:universal stress protein [Litorisediminicola beolgyonensis]|uniref:Universal stress protein n=1 Tax=Litorisediminicola beolgyonensis TaxID=1173614 RepID=A0ABW3ZDC3_9RHOB